MTSDPAARPEKPSVSVIVPCHDYGHYLAESVSSALEQEGVDVRVLIIDDASTDDSAAVAARLCEADSRVELQRHDTNIGHIPTYNEGLRWANGKYTVLLDADDILAPGALQRACALLESHPEVGFAYGRTIVFADGHPRPEVRTKNVDWTITPGRQWLETRCREAANSIYSPEVVVRTDLLQRVGGYLEELPHAGDFEMWMRLAVYADVGFVGGAVQAWYRDHPAGMHHRYATPSAALAQIKSAFVCLFRDHGANIPDRARLETLYREKLAKLALRTASRNWDRGPLDLEELRALAELAVATDPAVVHSSEMLGLRLRSALGPRAAMIVNAVFPVLRRIRKAFRSAFP